MINPLKIVISKRVTPVCFQTFYRCFNLLSVLNMPKNKNGLPDRFVFEIFIDNLIPKVLSAVFNCFTNYIIIIILYCRWLDYSQFNIPIEGLPIMACKVPLKKVGNNFSIIINISENSTDYLQAPLIP